MVEVVYEKGVFLPAAGLWLDPWGRKPFAFVSHAHSDHTGRHDRILASPATARLASARAGIDDKAFEILPFGEERDFGKFRARLLPAGHVLGSAQILVTCAGGDLLYTGDFKLRRGLSSEAAEACPAETLVMETTYGLPRYIFPPADSVIAGIVKFCAEAIEDGEVPILLGYSLGKAQEILSALEGGGFEIMLHGSIAKMASIYGEFGIRLPGWVDWNSKESEGRVLICPPSVAGSRAVTGIPHRRVAAVSGWALDPGAVHRMRVDAAFPLSDHADYSDLLAMVERVGPRRVLTLHGFAQEFARDLRARGVEAWALTGPNQLEWDAMAPRQASPVSSAFPSLRPGGFEGFATICESVREATGRLQKIRLLASYLRALRTNELRWAAVWLTGRPFARADDRSLNIGGAVIRRALAVASGQSEAEVRAAIRRNNDTGLTAIEVLAQRPGPFISPSIPQVAAVFASLAAKTGPLAKVDALACPIRTMHPTAAGYFVRIMTGNLRIGLKEGLLEEALAETFGREVADVRQANMLLGDIGETALAAASGRLATAKLTVFRPVQCMLAGPEPDATAVWERHGGNGQVWVEDKMDGIRAQVHARGDRGEIYSRDAKNLTASFPEIAKAAADLGGEAVLDGEILAWDAGAPLPFAVLQRRLGRGEQEDLFLPSGIPVRFLAFDILARNGTTLLPFPLLERRKYLETLAFQEPLAIAPFSWVKSVEGIDEAFEAARARGHEGLLIKDPFSPYSPGRRGLSWIKLKKRFATLDVVVVAAEYGHGKRRNVLSDLTFAVRSESGFLPIGKAYTGLTDAEIEELTAHFLAHAINRSGNRIEVEPLIVLEIAFDAIRPSDRHASGLALRFPRIARIRHDKTPEQIDTLETAKHLAGKP